MPPHFLMTHLNIILPTTPVSQVVSFPQVSPPNACIYLSPIHATCSVLLILLVLITPNILRVQIIKQEHQHNRKQGAGKAFGIGRCTVPDILASVAGAIFRVNKAVDVTRGVLHRSGGGWPAEGCGSDWLLSHTSLPPRDLHSKLLPPSNPQLHSPCRWKIQRLSKVDYHSSTRTDVLDSSRESLRSRIILMFF